MRAIGMWRPPRSAVWCRLPWRKRSRRSGLCATAPGPVVPRPGTDPPLPDKPSIAVLPFQNMSGDPEQEYFVDGMVEEIITALRLGTLTL